MTSDTEKKQAAMASLLRTLSLLVLSLICLLIILMSAGPTLSIRDETRTLRQIDVMQQGHSVRLPVDAYLLLRSATELSVIRITSNMKILRGETTINVATSEWMTFGMALPKSLAKSDRRGMSAACEIIDGDRVYPGALRSGPWSLEWRSGNFLTIPAGLQFAVVDGSDLREIDLLSLHWHVAGEAEKKAPDENG